MSVLKITQRTRILSEEGFELLVKEIFKVFNLRSFKECPNFVSNFV